MEKGSLTVSNAGCCLGSILRASFHSELYIAAYGALFLIAILLGYAVPAALVLYIPLAIGLGLSALALAAWAFYKQQWAVGAGHILAPLIAAILTYLGFLGGQYISYGHHAAKLSKAVEVYASGDTSSVDGVEIIRTDPKVAAILMSYSSFAGIPGRAIYLIQDQTGRFKDLAPLGRTRELAENPELRARKYNAYCISETRHIFGAYYEGVRYDVDDCH